MKKIFSLWLLDIAKYVVTALVLTTVLTDVSNLTSRWIFYTSCFVVISAIIVIGVLLYKSDEKNSNKSSN